MENGFTSQENEIRHGYKGKTLSPVSVITPKAKKNLLIPPVKGDDYENLFPNELL